MTLQEIFQRIVRAHWLVITVCAVLPVLAVLALEQRTAAKWTGSVRIQVASSAPVSTTEADAVSSRVLALATTPTLVAKAMSEAGLNGDASWIAQHEVSATRLGESPVVDVSVTDTTPQRARALSTALVQQVVDFINNGSRQGLDRNVRSLDAQIADATDQRTNLTARIPFTGRPAARQALIVRIGAVQDKINQLEQQRAALLQTKLEADQAVVIDGDSPEVRELPSSLVPRAAIALVLGLIVGLAVAALLETLAPRLAGIRSLARALGAPVLGGATDDPEQLAESMTRAARRQGVETVVLVGIDDEDEAVASRVLAALSSRDTQDENQESEDETSPVAPPRMPVRTQGRMPGKATRPAPGGRGRSFQQRHPVTDPFSVVEVSFSGLSGLPAEAEPTAGVVVVSDGSSRVRDLDSLQDRLTALRWPVVGIVEHHHPRTLPS